MTFYEYEIFYLDGERENHNNPDVPRIQSVIEILALLAQTQEGTEVGCIVVNSLGVG